MKLDRFWRPIFPNIISSFVLNKYFYLSPLIDFIHYTERTFLVGITSLLFQEDDIQGVTNRWGWHTFQIVHAIWYKNVNKFYLNSSLTSHELSVCLTMKVHILGTEERYLSIQSTGASQKEVHVSKWITTPFSKCWYERINEHFVFQSVCLNNLKMFTLPFCFTL